MSSKYKKQKCVVCGSVRVNVETDCETGMIRRRCKRCGIVWEGLT